MKQDVFIAIMSCKKNAALREAIRQSWLVDCPYSYCFFIGGTKPVDALSDEVYLDCLDTYEALVAKTIAIMEYAVGTGHKHILKCDDDSCVNWKRMEEIKFHEFDYAGRIFGYFRNQGRGKIKIPGNDRQPDEAIIPFASGMGYIISRESAIKFLTVALKSWNGVVLAEDVYVGNVLFQRGVKLSDISVFGLYNIEEYFVRYKSFSALLDCFIVHHCSSFDLYCIHNKKFALLKWKYMLIMINNFLVGQIKQPHAPKSIFSLMGRGDGS